LDGRIHQPSPARAAGEGQSHLAVALGVKAREQGCEAAFHRFEDPFTQCARTPSTPPAQLRRKKSPSVSSFVVDEVGSEVMETSGTALFFRRIRDR